MNNATKEQVVIAACSQTRTKFGLILRQIEGRWYLWKAGAAVPVFPSGRATQLDTSGGLDLGANYPGCPHCTAKSIFKCGTCSEVSCWNSVDRYVTCGHCTTGATISGSITSLGTSNG